jgi:hypothetical protein
MITPGAIFIQNGTLLPEPLRLGTDSQTAGWALVSNSLDHHELEHKLSTGGWTFFYMAGAIRTTVFGFDRAKMLHSALKQLLANVKLQKCNCLEIDDITTRSFLGMPYVSVSGHTRHIQQGVLFESQQN